MSDKSQTPTGVFVRLPLSDEQKTVFYDLVSKGSATNTILAIGTPVTGGELFPIGYINEDAIGGLACGIYQSASVFRDKDAEHHDDVALTRMSVALAKLAEKDAEIARLRAGLARIEQQADEYPGDDAAALGWIVSECDALKGPEA